MIHDEIKRKIRKLKKLELKIRFDGADTKKSPLVWDSYFDLRSEGKAKYSLHDLASMDKEAYKKVINEYFARVYYEYYKENGLVFTYTAPQPTLLEQLELPYDAGYTDVKKRFRELAKKYHPDTGGDAAKFIELMQVYEKLTL